MTVRTQDTVVVDGIEYERSVQHRCLNIDRHRLVPSRVDRPMTCSCHRTIPMPCPYCYAVEVLTRTLPWSALRWERQPGAEGGLDD